MATIVKKKTRQGLSYHVVYRFDGKQHWKRAGKRRIDADRLKAKIEHDLNAGAHREMPDIGLKDFVEKWLSSKRADIRPKTFAGYKAHLKRKIVPYFRNQKLKSVTTEQVEEFKAHLVQSGDMSAATVGKYLLTLKMVFKTAVVWGYMGRNPAQYVKRPLATKRQPEFLTPNKLDLLIKATREEHRALIATAVFTGTRQGELLALTWDDIDLENRKIFVKKTLQQGRFFDPKSESSRRSIDIPDFLVRTLKEHELRQVVNGPATELNLVFPNEVGKPMDRANLERRIFKPALKLAGLRTGIRFHSLRHSYASMLIHQGANIKYVQKQLGHANIQQTLNTYSHLLPEAGQEAIRKLDKIFAEERSKIKT